MKNLKFVFFVLAMLAAGFFSGSLMAQKVAFVVSDVIRDHFTEAKQAEQRVRSMVEDWKRELDNLDKKIEDLKNEINKSRLIWTDEEKANKDKELSDIQTQRLEYSRRKFEPTGEYDQTVKQMMKPVEDKIYAAVQQVAADEGYDVILDKSSQNIPYINSKFDMTVKVLRKLGVDVEKLEKELQEKIAKDPRNQVKESKQAPGKRTKSRTGGDTEIKRDDSKPAQTPTDTPNKNDIFKNPPALPDGKPPVDSTKPFKIN